MDNFLLFTRLEDFERWPIEELGLDHVVQSVKVESLVALFHTADVGYFLKIKRLFPCQADYTGIVHFDETCLLIDNDALYLAAVQERHSKDEDDNRNQVLPPRTKQNSS